MEFLVVAVVFLAMALVEASSFKYWSRFLIKSVMPSWCMIEMSLALRWV